MRTMHGHSDILIYASQEHGGKIPVFRPTMKEFKDFKAFMEAIDDFGKRSGIVKVIPPKEWYVSV